MTKQTNLHYVLTLCSQWVFILKFLKSVKFSNFSLKNVHNVLCVLYVWISHRLYNYISHIIIWPVCVWLSPYNCSSTCLYSCVSVLQYRLIYLIIYRFYILNCICLSLDVSICVRVQWCTHFSLIIFLLLIFVAVAMCFPFRSLMASERVASDHANLFLIKLVFYN